MLLTFIWEGMVSPYYGENIASRSTFFISRLIVTETGLWKKIPFARYKILVNLAVNSVEISSRLWVLILKIMHTDCTSNVPKCPVEKGDITGMKRMKCVPSDSDSGFFF